MEIENYERDIPYWNDSGRKTIIDYSIAVVDMIRSHLNCSLFESIFVFINSGIYDIIAQDPEVASHLDLEEWVENIDAFVRRDLLGHNALRNTYNSKALFFSKNGMDNKNES